MADVNRGNRPLSPHLTIYRPQITSVLSILHRLTGIAMAFVAMLVVWWFLAAATGPDYFATVDWILTSWIGHLVLIAAIWALWFHFANGIRHLLWDLGYGYELLTVTRTGQAVVAASAILTLVTLAVAFW
ncbi:MAG TPA: succinate dehydrogenase, cytochrome b556 subunit [Paracoccaceae bacterium]|nr:succinate dehydrogenase, cytochrome b556 subunit [Paracoccaceae bacterium]